MPTDQALTNHILTMYILITYMEINYTLIKHILLEQVSIHNSLKNFIQLASLANNYVLYTPQLIWSWVSTSQLFLVLISLHNQNYESVINKKIDIQKRLFCNLSQVIIRISNHLSLKMIPVLCTVGNDANPHVDASHQPCINPRNKRNILTQNTVNFMLLRITAKLENGNHWV